MGAVPFEVIAGTPAARYGARITVRLPTNKGEFLAHFGLENHPWGQAEWVGVRTFGEGEMLAKPYHKLVRAGPLPFQAKLSDQLYPVMASLHRGSHERYFRCRGSHDWDEFVQSCILPLNGSTPKFALRPRPVESGFCVSVRYIEEDLESISVFADYRALPDDDTIFRLWSQDMDGPEVEAYELALAGVRTMGRRRLGSWHAMLGWTLERNGEWHKAASLRFPPI